MQAWLALRATAAIGERPAAPVPMIGRDRELGVLTGVWERVVDEGQEPLRHGVRPGRASASRGSRSSSHSSSPAQGARVIRGRSTPYGASSPYSAFAQQVKQIARIFDSDDAAEAHGEARRRRSPSLAGPAAAEEHAPNLAMLLGLDDEAARPPTASSSSSRRACSSSRSRCAGPTLLVYEDIHWADASLLDLLETFARPRARRAGAVPRARPARAPRRAAGLGRRPARVHGASARAARRRRRSRARRRAPRAGSTRRRAPSRSRRRPRATRSSSRSSPMPRRAAGRRGSTSCRRASARSSPPGSTRCRPTERAVLVDASVVGRVFWRGALCEIDDRADLRHGARLARGARPDPARGGVPDQGDQQFAFKHGLIHDVAYGDAAARGPPRQARGGRALPRGDDRRRPVARGARPPLARGRRERARGRAPHGRRRPGGRGWAKQRAVALYREALELLADDDARRRDVTRRLAVALQAVVPPRRRRRRAGR